MKILSVVGARPQFVKLAPVAHAAAAADVEHAIVHTGQHYDPMLSDVFFRDLGIPAPDRHLGVGSGGHGAQTGQILAAMDDAITELAPDVVLVYGDTNSTLAGALSAVKLHVPVAHLEAGLRSFNRAMPEEINRVLTDHAADLCLAPTAVAVEHLAAEGIAVKWVFSQGSNRSLEYLNGGSVDFASTAGLAAVLSRANGSPVKTVYIASRPEWTALAVPKDSPIKTLADLKGKKVAATKGTDPYLFLLRSLQSAGLGKGDVEIVHLQHPDGRVALERGDVDAWSGLDPHLAASQLQAGSRLLYRNVEFNSYGVLNVSDRFLKEQPQLIGKVIAAYEEARQWTLAHPQQTAELLASDGPALLHVAIDARANVWPLVPPNTANSHMLDANPAHRAQETVNAIPA